MAQSNIQGDIQFEGQGRQGGGGQNLGGQNLGGQGKIVSDPLAGLSASSDFSNFGGTPRRKGKSGNFTRELLITIFTAIPGSLSGILTVYMSMMVAVLAFFYDVNNLFYQGMFIILLTTFFATLPIAILSGFPGVSASVSTTNAVLMGLFIYKLISEQAITYTGLSVEYSGILLSMAVVGMSVSAMYFLVGIFKLSRIFAFAPEVIFATIQVVIAMMMVLMAFSILTGDLIISWPSFVQNFSIEIFNDIRVQFAVGVGVLMSIIMSLFRSHIVLPLLLVAVLAGFYLWGRGFMGMDFQDMVDAGWLLPIGDTDITSFAVSKITINNVVNFNFGGLRDYISDIVVICIVLLINSLEVNRRLEESVEAYTHPAREITAVSFSSFISALTSGFSVHHSSTATTFSNQLGGRRRSAGIAAGIVCCLVAFFALPYIQLIPMPMVAATLICFASLYFIKWLIRGIRNLDFMEYVLIVIALIFTFFLGYNAGLIFGILSGAVVFMLTHSRISGIKRVLSGKVYHSSTERLPQIVKLLDSYGDSILIIQMEATLVYGMMYEITHMVVGRANDHRQNPLGYILLDFSTVRNIDVTVLDQMHGLFEVAEHHDVVIVVCGLHHNHADLFKRVGFFDLRRKLNIKIMPTLDVSLEWCEDDLLSTIGNIDEAIIKFDFETWLSDRLGDEDSYTKLLNYTTEEVLQEGENIAQQYVSADKIYIIKSGSMDVSLEVPNHERVHLRKLKEGALIGELGFYLGIRHNVNVVALEQTVVMVLDRQALAKIAGDDPQLMLALHRMMVIYLSTRVSYVSRMLQVLIASDDASGQ
ncbi:MAG: cyclic nucleotide-binding domain-containing protein [Alphaproteobacteria bacterium]|nr:cyclic nucleotide-binding domain-containing protein [Alphaproteobacteria bacterium]